MGASEDEENPPGRPLGNSVMRKNKGPLEKKKEKKKERNISLWREGALKFRGVFTLDLEHQSRADLPAERRAKLVKVHSGTGGYSEVESLSDLVLIKKTAKRNKIS